MTTKMKYIYFFIIIVTNAVTYNVTVNHIKFDAFLSEIKYDFILLKMLKKNRSIEVEKLLTNDIQRVYYEAGQTKDINIFLPFCEYITKEDLIILTQPSNATFVDTGYGEQYKTYNIGREKINKLCNKPLP